MKTPLWHFARMAWTQSDLDAINAAIATGAKSVAFGTHSVTYQSAAEMLQIKTEIEKALRATASPTIKRLTPRHQLADFSDG